jgi:hypothetical protein
MIANHSSLRDTRTDFSREPLGRFGTKVPPTSRIKAIKRRMDVLRR